MDLPITVRKMNLELPAQDEFDPLWAMNDPAASYFTLGLSLYLPYLEPYIIKALRMGAADVHDAAVMDKLDKFCRQEAQHYKQHERFNALIHARDYPGLDAIENRVVAAVSVAASLVASSVGGVQPPRLSSPIAKQLSDIRTSIPNPHVQA